jgi:hypothetical protein
MPCNYLAPLILITMNSSVLLPFYTYTHYVRWWEYLPKAQHYIFCLEFSFSLQTPHSYLIRTIKRFWLWFWIYSWGIKNWSVINILRNKNTYIMKILLSLEFLHSVAYILTFYYLSTHLERLWHHPRHKLQQIPKVCISPTRKGVAGEKRVPSATFLRIGSWNLINMIYRHTAIM